MSLMYNFFTKCHGWLDLPKSPYSGLGSLFDGSPYPSPLGRGCHQEAKGEAD